jgi:dTDP-4-amino-4,6-dideoxygalactose transaminase
MEHTESGAIADVERHVQAGRQVVADELEVPFYRPDLGQEEVNEVVATLRSGWLTTGPRVLRFEREFAEAVGAAYAVAVNSCTAALHLAVEALGLEPNDAVLVPAMTFAATAEVVRYQGAIPILVDCDPVTGNMDLGDAERKLALVETNHFSRIAADLKPVGIIPVHVGGLMMDVQLVQEFASRHRLWVVEDAAHAFPAAWRTGIDKPWRRCGESSGAVTCFSFYANKTITSGEGGMAVTNLEGIANRMRMMSLHGLTNDAWARYYGKSWDYKIVAPGFKYNLTDIAAAIGASQLARAESMRRKREAVASRYFEELDDVVEIQLPHRDENRVHSWHLFPIRLNLERLSVNRNSFMEELKQAGVACSVHWRPLHLHPYYQEAFHWKPEDCPAATTLWERLVSLPIFPGMLDREVQHVIRTVRRTCACYGR